MGRGDPNKHVGGGGGGEVYLARNSTTSDGPDSITIVQIQKQVLFVKIISFAKITPQCKGTYKL